MYLLVLGCSAGGTYACQNNGVCVNSVCQCTGPYTGTTCQTCLFMLYNY